MASLAGATGWWVQSPLVPIGRPGVMLFAFSDRGENGVTFRCCPGPSSFTDSCAAATLNAPWKMAPSLGVAPSSDCLTGSLHTPCIRRYRDGRDGRTCTCVVVLPRHAPGFSATSRWIGVVFLPRFALGAHSSRGCMILLHHRNGKVADTAGAAPAWPRSTGED